jgi:hypothetical protein
MGKPGTWGGNDRKKPRPYWVCASCNGWTYCDISATACHGCKKPPKSPVAGAPAANRSKWPTPGEWHKQPRGKDQQRKVRSAAAAAIDVLEDAAEDAESEAAPTIPGVKKFITDMEAMVSVHGDRALAGLAADLAEQKAVLAGLLAAQREGKPPSKRVADADRREQQCLAKVEKAAQAIVDTAAAHALLVDKHVIAMAAAQATFVAAKLLTVEAKKEHLEAIAAAGVAAAPPAPDTRESILAELKAKQDRLAAFDANVAAVAAAAPVPGEAPPSSTPRPAAENDRVMQEEDEDMEAAALERDEKRQREVQNAANLKEAADAQGYLEAQASAKKAKKAINGPDGVPLQP